MIRPSPMLHQLSHRIMKYEIGQRESPEEIAAAIERGFQRFQSVLFNLVGKAGFDALLARAAHLTKREFGWVEAVLIPATAPATFTDPVVFQDLPRIVQSEGAPRVIDGVTTVLENLLALLCAFIGEDLTLRLVRRTWTEVSLALSGCVAKEGQIDERERKAGSHEDAHRGARVRRGARRRTA